jgi:hypothetical protein
MKLRLMAAVLGAALAFPVAAQTPAGGAADGTPVTIAGVSAITVNRPGTVTTAVKLREKPSTSARIVEYWATTTQKEPELFMAVGATVTVVARTVNKEKVGDWNNSWYRVEITTEKQGTFQAWAYGEFVRIEAAGAHEVVAIAAGMARSYAVARDGSTVSRSTPVRVGPGSDWAALSNGGGHSLALKHNGSLVAWGLGDDGQLGDGAATNRTRPVQVGPSTDWVSVAAGLAHSLAVKRDGTLWASGWNTDGQLGDGTTADRSVPVPVAGFGGVAATTTHAELVRLLAAHFASGALQGFAMPAEAAKRLLSEDEPVFVTDRRAERPEKTASWRSCTAFQGSRS